MSPLLATHPTYGEQWAAIRAATPHVNDAAMLGAIGRGYGDAGVGWFQGAVQGAHDLWLGMVNAEIAQIDPFLAPIPDRDLFGAPTSSWQGTGRVIGEVTGVPIPATAAVRGARLLSRTAGLVRLADAAPSMRASVAAELAGLRAAGLNPRKLSPSISVAFDIETGQQSLVYLNRTGPPATLNPVLAERLEAAGATGYGRSPGGAGSHSEIYAVNELLNGGSRLENIATYTQELRISRYLGQYKPACPHCRVLLEGVTYVE